MHRLALFLQASLTASVLIMLCFAPPEHGRTLLIPIGGSPISGALLDAAMLRPVRAGPVAGSLVVEGRGRSLAAAMFHQRILMLAAPDIICGSQSQDVRNG